jgi:hypothetical protein
MEEKIATFNEEPQLDNKTPIKLPRRNRREQERQMVKHYPVLQQQLKQLYQQYQIREIQCNIFVDKLNELGITDLETVLKEGIVKINQRNAKPSENPQVEEVTFDSSLEAPQQV